MIRQLKIQIASLALLMISAGTASAQGGSFTGNAPVYKTSLDTVSNTGTKTYNLPVASQKNLITLWVDFRKISGTTTSSYIQWMVSADNGATYLTIATDTLAAASTQYKQHFTGNPYTHYRIVITGAGTQSSSFRAWAVIR